MKILLIFPPEFTPLVPYPSIYYIKGFLHRHGHKHVCVLDLNLNYKRYIYENHETTLKKLSNLISSESGSLKRVLDRAVNASANIKPALRYFSRNAVESPNRTMNDKYAESLDAALEAYRCWCRLSCGLPDKITDLKEMVSYVESIDFPHSEFYNREFVRLKEQCNYDFIGISYGFLRQGIHSLAAAKWAKKVFPKAHICFGGSYLTRTFRAGNRSHKLSVKWFRYMDSAVLGEGEHSILELMQYIQGLRKEFPGHVDIVLPSRRIIPTCASPHNDLFEPDYSTLQFRKYFNISSRGKRLKPLSFLLSRGCYWRKCRFCSSHHVYRSFVVCDDVEKLVKAIRKYKKGFNVKLIRFNDEAAPKNVLSAVSNELIGSRIKIDWATNIRADWLDDMRFYIRLRQSGCRRLLIGVESGSQKVVDLMNKGIKVVDVELLLKRLHRAGIKAHLYIMCFYPGETTSDLQQTLDMLYRNRKYIYSFAVSPFEISVFAPIFYDYFSENDIKGIGATPVRIEVPCAGKMSRRRLEVYNKIVDLQLEMSRRNFSSPH